MSKSFFDLDYIIELNERGIEKYEESYEKILQKFTNLIIIYTGISVFLIPITQRMLEGKDTIYNYIFFALFLVFLSISVAYTVKLLIPVKIAYLLKPKEYYTNLRLRYENRQLSVQEMDGLIKASYITALETAFDKSFENFTAKRSYYQIALTFSLLAVIPYLICLGFYLSKKDDNIQKNEVVNKKLISILHKK
jgi:hypothetical protein